MILSHPQRWLRKSKYQVKANFQGTGGLGQPVGIRTALEVDESTRAGEMWQLLGTLINRRCWLKLHSLEEVETDKMSTARVYVGNHRTRPTGPSPGLPGSTGTWQVWAARQQPLCLSAFGKSSSRLNGGKEWLP